jgi:hypothetical protein
MCQIYLPSFAFGKGKCVNVANMRPHRASLWRKFKFHFMGAPNQNVETYFAFQKQQQRGERSENMPKSM